MSAALEEAISEMETIIHLATVRVNDGTSIQYVAQEALHVMRDRLGGTNERDAPTGPIAAIRRRA